MDRKVFLKLHYLHQGSQFKKGHKSPFICVIILLEVGVINLPFCRGFCWLEAGCAEKHQDVLSQGHFYGMANSLLFESVQIAMLGHTTSGN